MGALWIAFFPGAVGIARQIGLAGPLEAVGITLPAQEAAGPGGGGRPGGGGFGRFSRASTVVLKAATSEIINDKVSALGSGEAIQSVTVLPEVSGTLKAIPVQAGTVVKPGDVIAQLDMDVQQLALDKARLTFDDAQRTLARTQQLGQTNAVPASQIQSAELAAKSAEIDLRTAEKNLADRTITAPIAGTVGILQVGVGTDVTAQTALTTIVDSSKLRINFWLPERLSGKVSLGDPAQVVPVALPQLSLDATVSAIDNRIDPASGTFQVQAEVSNADGRLSPGMAFTVSLKFPGDSFIAVDPLTIQWGTDGSYVWRVVDDKAEKVPVRIVQRNTDSVLVAGEVKVGDMLVTEGLAGLSPGATVQVQGAPPADAAGGQQAGGGSAAKAPGPGSQSGPQSGGRTGNRAGGTTAAAAPASGN